MNKHKISILILLLFVSILSISLMMGAVTVTKPASSATISGVAILNATGTQLTSCNFYAKSASTANSTWRLIAASTNNTAADQTGYINGSFNSVVLEDSNDYIFNATCLNWSSYSHEGLTTGVIIDNTIPQTPTTTSYTDDQSITSATTLSFSYTVTDSNTTSCTYKILRNNNANDGDSASGTYSTSTCTFSKILSTTADNGLWYVTATASDGTNSSTSSVIKINFQMPGSGSGGIVTGTTTNKVTIKDKMSNFGHSFSNYGRSLKDYIRNFFINFKNKFRR